MAMFKVSEKLFEKIHRLTIYGKIAEDVSFDGIDLTQRTIIHVDFKHVIGINSGGIREWINFMKKVPRKSRVICTNCSVEIINQVNMIEGFLPLRSFIKTFFVPYFCESCGNQTEFLIERKRRVDPIPELDEFIKCHKCGEEAEIDILESSFMAFKEKF
ncbi:MAG: hypothetical protein KAQ98_01120 [Bacteriovoracaceae bacterium]|nr:hypothetical protein [Bacteriovoracaceae bacterium]